MALIIPTSYSGHQTFADATKTEGGPLRKYVLAQFRSDSDFNWVGQLRARLVKDELKYKDFKGARPWLRKKRELWRKIENGIGQASIIVIDPEPIYDELERFLQSEGAEKKIDFDEKSLINGCATAIIGMTPIAYLPFKIASDVPWSLFYDFENLENFLPEKIKRKIGGKLNDARIFAARAHATFEVVISEDSKIGLPDIYNSQLNRVILAEVISTSRIFDEEHPKSIKVLNEVVSTISSKLDETSLLWREPSESEIIKEANSRDIDELQAADIAVGWAREILEVADVNSLASRFERVWHNGLRIK